MLYGVVGFESVGFDQLGSESVGFDQLSWSQVLKSSFETKLVRFKIISFLQSNKL